MPYSFPFPVIRKWRIFLWNKNAVNLQQAYGLECVLVSDFMLLLCSFLTLQILMKLIAYKHTAHVHHHAAHHSHIHLHGLKLSHSWFLVSVVHVFTTLCGVLYARCVGLSRVICKFAVINDGHSIIWHCSFKSHSLHHLLSASGPQWCSCQKTHWSHGWGGST